jgi:hypothetical protein
VMRGLLRDTTHAVRRRSEARELTRRSAKTRTKNPHRASRSGQSTDPPALGST